MIKKRPLTKTRLFFVLFISVFFVLVSTSSYATIPNTDDYQLEVTMFEWTDEIGRSISSNFSTDTFSDSFTEITFSDTSVISRATADGTHPYLFGALTSDTKYVDGTLHLDSGICTVGIKDTESHDDQSFPFPIGFGGGDFHDFTMAMEFSNFKNVDFSVKSQKAWTFEIWFSSSGGTVSTYLEAIWFNGTYGGTEYDNAIVFFLGVNNDPLMLEEEIETIVEGLDPDNDTVALRMTVADDGNTLYGWYSINGGDWVQVGKIDSPWQITAYAGEGDFGNVPGVGLRYEGAVTDEDSGAAPAAPAAAAPAGDGGGSSGCFISTASDGSLMVFPAKALVFLMSFGLICFAGFRKKIKK